MKKCRLGADLEISKVITGLWQIADVERKEGVLDPQETALSMKPYVESGFTTFDMADHYGSAELIAGAFNKLNPGSSQLLTKWVPRPGQLTRDDVKTAVEKALKRLESNAIDLLQYHAWNYADASYLDQLFWLQELKEEGLVRNIGVTNFDATHLRIAKVSGVDIVSNQICYSLLDQRATAQMTSTCEELGIKILAFGTVAGGFLTDKWVNKNDPSASEIDNWSLMKYKRFIEVIGGWEKYQNVLSAIQIVAKKQNVSMANISTKYILMQPAVGGVIVGARLGESEHIEDNLKLFDFSLDLEDLSTIKDALTELNPVPGECGDEYRKPPFLTASGDLSHHLDQIPKPFEPIKAVNGTKVLSGTTWEKEFGYCRAIKNGNSISVAGTTASHGDQLIGGSDAGAQTHFVIDKIEGAIQSLGGKLEDVVRTRIFVQNLDDWEPIAKAHGERFKDIQPVNTLVQANLVGKEYLVEIEAEAIVN